MNKIRNNKMLLSGLVAAGLALSAPHNAFAGKEDKTDKTEHKMDKTQGVKSNVRINLDGTQVVFNGQTYTLSGDLHGTLSVKEKQGDRALVKAHLNAQGIKVTAPDGTVYNGVGAINFQARTDDDGVTFKAVANVGLIGKGKAPNFRLKLNLRGTVDTSNATLVLDGADMS